MQQIARLLVGLIAGAVALSLPVQSVFSIKSADGSANLSIAEGGYPVAPAFYDPGTPTLTDLWVDPVNGSDANTGASPASAFQTLDYAWASIPMGVALTTGVRINLVPGNYPVANLPNYWESRYGTFAAPIFIQGTGSEPGQVVLQGNVNMYDVRYVYFDNLSILNDGDPFHCELCDHLLLRNMILNGGALNQAQETIKVNRGSDINIKRP